MSAPTIPSALAAIATGLHQLAEAMGSYADSQATPADPQPQPTPAPQPAPQFQPQPTPAPQTEPAAMASLFGGGGGAPVAQSQPAPQPAAQPTKEDVVSTFQTLHQAKGPEAIVGPAGILVRFGVQRLSDLPESQWADAIAMAQQAMS